MTGRDWALVGRSDATAFVDLSDPTRPRYAGELPLTEGAIENLWRDIKVYRDHAFIVADGAGSHGVQIFDLTQLRDAAGPPVTFEPRPPVTTASTAPTTSSSTRRPGWPTRWAAAWAARPAAAAST